MPTKSWPDLHLFFADLFPHGYVLDMELFSDTWTQVRADFCDFMVPAGVSLFTRRAAQINQDKQLFRLKHNFWFVPSPMVMPKSSLIKVIRSNSGAKLSRDEGGRTVQFNLSILTLPRSRALLSSASGAAFSAAKSMKKGFSVCRMATNI